MNQFKIVLYTKELMNKWEEIVTLSQEATIFHSQTFLSYHLDKFSDNELNLLCYQGDKLIGICPGVLNYENNEVIFRSPFGGSFGGWAFSKKLNFFDLDQIIKLFIEYLSDLNCKKCHIMPVTGIYSNDQILEYVLYTNGFILESYDISNYIDLRNCDDSFKLFDSKCRNQVRSGIERCKDIDLTINEVFDIIQNEKIRNKARPTHSLEELSLLKKKIGDKMFYYSMQAKTNGAKGIILCFKNTEKIISTFYISQETEAKGSNILNALMYKVIQNALEDNIEFIDLGTSSLNGKIENFGIIRFKESFGADSLLRKKYLLRL